MNHNTARCSSCNTICVLPHLRARASTAKCEACARREAERVREMRSDEYATSPSQTTPRYMTSYPGTFVDDKWEQRARELTEEKRRDLLAFPNLAEYNAASDEEDACCSFLSYLGAFGGPDVYRRYRDEFSWHPQAGSIPCKCGGWITPHFQHDTPGCGPKGVLAADGTGGLVDPYLTNRFDVFVSYRSNLSLHEQARLAR